MIYRYHIRSECDQPGPEIRVEYLDIEEVAHLKIVDLKHLKPVVFQ